MAVVVDLGAIAALTVEGRQEGQQVLTVLHYRWLPAGALATNAKDTADAFIAGVTSPGALVPLYVGSMSEEWEFIRMKVQWIKPFRYAAYSYLPTQANGEVAGSCNPVNVAVTVTRRGELANRHNIGSTHLPGVPLNDLDGSKVINPGLAQYKQLAGALIASVPTVAVLGEMVPVIYDKSSPATSAIPQTSAVQPYSRTMHRRTVGVGS